jgi:uncharacterized OB-fold protein
MSTETPAPEPRPKPLPQITDENRPFWGGCVAGSLRMQRCTACSHVRWPIQALCPRCLADTFAWDTLSGRGEVFAKVVYRRAFNPAFAPDVPYNLVLVQLAEGPRMYSNVVDAAPAEITVGAPLAVCFDEVAPGVLVPRFRLSST